LTEKKSPQAHFVTGGSGFRTSGRYFELANFCSVYIDTFTIALSRRRITAACISISHFFSILSYPEMPARDLPLGYQTIQEHLKKL
jgi:hypothetical protein